MSFEVIKTVKEINNKKGYLINNCISFVIDENSELLDSVKQWVNDGGIIEPEFTEEELESQRLAELKRAKTDALTKIVVEVNGKAFDGNEPARLNMISAIQASELLGVNDNAWKLADNSVATVSVADLKQALALAIQEVGRIVMVESIEEL